jgi:hypothetical protein
MRNGLGIHRVSSPRGFLADAFVRFPFRLYSGSRQWVPCFDRDIRAILGRRHAFFSHSDGEFFVALRAGEPVARIAALENRRDNTRHRRKEARFYFFEAVDDAEVVNRLFGAGCDWAAGRGLDTIAGPLGFSSMTGGGILVDGFEHRAAMTMMGYHLPYYRALIEGEGFEKRLDLYSAYLDAVEFRLPERIQRVAEIALKRGRLRVAEFGSRRDLAAMADRIGRLYNEAFSDQPDHLPLTQAEIDELGRTLLAVADPRLIKIILLGEEIAGFLFAFPDLSAAMQRARGRLNPLTLLSLLRERGRSRRLIINGMGIVPRHRRSGANAVLYYELARATKDMGFQGADLVQIKESTDLMLSDIENLGGRIHKTHRVYAKRL